MPIQTLVPRALAVLKPILAVVQPEDGVFVASFYDANLHASGESPADAIDMLKDVISQSYRVLTTNEDALAIGPANQLAVLREFVQPK